MNTANVSRSPGLSVQHILSEHGTDGEAAIIRADFATRQVDGSHPFVVERAATFADDVAQLIPKALDVVRMAHTGGEGQLILARNENCSALIRHEGGVVTITIAATSLQRARRMVDKFVQRLPEPPIDEKTALSIWHWSAERPSCRSVRIDTAQWADIASNYPAPVRAALTRLVALERPSAGKLILWHGAPGTGKTTAIRALAREWESWCRTSYVADPEKLFADTGYLVNVVTRLAVGRDGSRDRRWQLIVAEDSDEYLRTSARREAGAALGRLLNITDGILGHGSNTLVLLTTNERIDRLHPALTRPGRSLASIEFEAFDAQGAAQWLPDGAVTPHGPATLAELYEMSGAAHRITNAAVEPEGIGTYL